MHEDAREYFVRKSPFWSMTQKHGCQRYATVRGMYYPMLFTDEVREYQRLIDAVTLWDVTAAERPIEISGRDAVAFLNLLITRDVRNCAVGQCRYVNLVNPVGGLIADSILLRLDERRFWMSGDPGWIRGVAVFAGMDVRISFPDVAVAQLQGPKAPLLIDDLLGADGRDLPFFHLIETNMDGIPVVVSRTGWSAERGYEFYLQDTERAERFWESVMEAGRRHEIAVTASSEMRRVEAGILNNGTDYTERENPFEVGLARFVDLDKTPDFIGKAALRRIADAGPARQLVGLEIDGELQRPFIDPWPVAGSGGPVGKVTMVVRSPMLEKTIGYAILPREMSVIGNGLRVIAPWGALQATVVPLPFVASKARD